MALYMTEKNDNILGADCFMGRHGSRGCSVRTEFGFGQQEEVWSWEKSALQAGQCSDTTEELRCAGCCKDSVYRTDPQKVQKTDLAWDITQICPVIRECPKAIIVLGRVLAESDTGHSKPLGICLLHVQFAISSKPGR